MARPRKPSILKLIAGTDQPCRTNKAEPKPRRERPSPPVYLSDKAKAAWGAASIILDRMGVLTEADGMALEGLCEAYADLRAARDAIAERGGSLSYTSATRDGGIMHRAYPEVAMLADADRRVSMWLAIFGLTPADRSRVSGSEKVDDMNPFRALFP